MSCSQLEKCIPPAPGESATRTALGDIPGAWDGVAQGWGVGRGMGWRHQHEFRPKGQIPAQVLTGCVTLSKSLTSLGLVAAVKWSDMP